MKSPHEIMLWAREFAEEKLVESPQLVSATHPLHIVTAELIANCVAANVKFEIAPTLLRRLQILYPDELACLPEEYINQVCAFQRFHNPPVEEN